MSVRLTIATLFYAVAIVADSAVAQTYFESHFDSSQVINNPSDSTATGFATLALNEAQTELSYSVQLNGLDLEPDAASRTDLNDVVAIHIHLNVQDVIGPHILNIFGFPAMEDDDLVIDFENDSFSGVFDASDATRDPDTGELEPQAFPLTTKLFPTDFRLAELLNDEWYFAVHTVGSASTPPGVTIRGAILVVPEPLSCLMALSCLGLLAAPRLSRSCNRRS